ncbi:MAG: hypothetical protein NTV46_14895 [Verrucomicrobia bacterium]|nr:hypothetical protein [Verrucomicrobiota bacterium]
MKTETTSHGLPLLSFAVAGLLALRAGPQAAADSPPGDFSRPEPHASPVPRQVFSETLAEQEKQLETSEILLRFAASRKKLASIPHRPAYHFVSPENMMNDPNGLCFWQGRWHLFYQAYPPDEFPDPKDIKKRRQHWGHAVSDDLVRWRDLPYAIHPGRTTPCCSTGKRPARSTAGRATRISGRKATRTAAWWADRCGPPGTSRIGKPGATS